MKKIAFHLQKGGVGKTTLSGNVAYAISETNKTALVDCDPQGNTSGWLLTQQVKHELVDALKGTVDVEDVLVKLKENLFIIPTFGLDGMLKSYSEERLGNEPFIFEDLTNALEKLGFEFVIFDLSPGMSRLERCVLIACDEVITPLTPEYFSIDGIEIFNNELKKLNKSFRKNIQHKKIVCNAINNSFKTHNEYFAEFQNLDYELYCISQDRKMADSQRYNKTIFEFFPSSKVVPELKRLAESIVR